MGAEVLRVDRAGAVGEPAPTWDVNARGRRSVGVDLKHPDGRETVLRLVERADALIEGFRPGVTERLGLGPDDCLARRPSPGLRPDDRVGAGRPAGAGRRSGHQLPRPVGNARHDRPGRRAAGAPADARRRLRRRRHAAGLRRRVRRGRGGPVGPGPGRRRGDGRRRRPARRDDARAAGRRAVGRAGHEPARQRSLVLRRLRDRRRAVRVGRGDRPAGPRRGAARDRAGRRRRRRRPRPRPATTGRRGRR